MPVIGAATEAVAGPVAGPVTAVDQPVGLLGCHVHDQHATVTPQAKTIASHASTDDPGPVPSRAWRPKLVLLLADAGAILAAAAVTALALKARLAHGSPAASKLWWSAVAALPLWLCLFANQRLYNIRFIGRRIDEFRRIVNATVLSTFAVTLVATVGHTLLPRSGIVMLAVIACVTTCIEREVARRTFRRLRARGRMVRQVIVVGANPEGQDIAAMLQSEPWLGYQAVGFVDDDAQTTEPVPGVPLLGAIADLPDLIDRYANPSVIVAATAVASSVINRLARDMLESGVHVELSSALRDISSQRLTVRPLGRFPVVYLEPAVRGGWRAVAKRTFDIFGAGLTLVAVSPILLAAMVAVKLDSPGPILFRQVRVGRNGTPFSVLKLRSMVADAEDHLNEILDLNEVDGPLFKLADDPRITRVGRIIRTSSIDELPQLWNVLRGEMSLVGPRPALPHEAEEWDQLLHQRLRVKPGITGMWQVSGRSDASFEDYTRLDLFYVDNWSLATDLAILAKTVPVVAFGRGAR